MYLAAFPAPARWILCLLVVSLGVIPACGGDEPLGPEPEIEITNPDTLTYAPELGVDLSAMTKTASGLYLQDLTVGAGRGAELGDTLVVDYVGWLHDGAQIDASSNPNRGPFRVELGVTNVIAGWEEGLAGMSVGGVRLLVIPPALAYGRNSLPPLIPGGATLVFWIELLQLSPMEEVQLQDPTTITYAPELDVDLSTMVLTESGLYLKDLVVGAGPAAAASDSLVIDYSGWVNDGTLFDTSRQAGRTPLEFRPSSGGLIDGWLEGVVGMQVGGTRQLVIPPALAYGSGSPSSLIPPGSVLIFEIELLNLNP